LILKDKVIMKKIRIVLTSLTFALALTGVIVAKANEKKRLTQNTVFFLDQVGTTWYSLSVPSSAVFSQSAGSGSIISSTNNGNIHLYASQSTSDPADFTQP
jgi:hypothetical protein